MNKKTKVMQAYERCRLGREALRSIDAVLMESTEDKAGIVWQRWYVQTSPALAVQQKTVNVIVFATPVWWDVFVPIVDSQETQATLDTIKALVKGA